MRFILASLAGARPVGFLKILVLGVSASALVIAFAGWWLTSALHENRENDDETEPVILTSPEPANLAGGSSNRRGQPGPSRKIESEPAPRAHSQSTWPDRLDGRPAKEFLLAWLKDAARTITSKNGYAFTFRKQERIKGKLLPEQTYRVKIRHDPFAVYMKCVAPTAGRELIYAEGMHENKVIAHGIGLSRLLIPRVQLPPDHPLIMAESRHPMNQAGLANMTEKMIHYRAMDLEDEEMTTVLDKLRDENGREWGRSSHVYPIRRPGRPFSRSEVHYDTKSGLPVRFSGYDWPTSQGEPGPLGERYVYEDLELDAALSATDFDPANPVYSFHRF